MKTRQYSIYHSKREFFEMFFSHFQTLNLQDNKLKALPSSIGSLKNLQTLNLAGNLLKVSLKKECEMREVLPGPAKPSQPL
jgi:Leucine-rich repeat (LRR) protein